MGGKGGALSAWMKEFTALVFTQTIQAFIYAIIISMILFGMVKNSGVSGSDNNSALGLMATFALLSVFKVESMARRIFGVGDTKASPGSAFRSIAKTAIAAKIGKRALDNTGKVLGGVGSIFKAGSASAKAKKRLKEDMQDNGFELGKDKKPVYVGKGSKATAVKTSASGSGSGVGNDLGGGSADGSGDVREAVSTAASNSMADASANVGTISDSDKRRVKNALRTYEDKIAEIKKSRNEGIKNMVSGVAEGFGALAGGTMGGILGGSDGNVDELIQGIMAGMGAGDALAQQTVNITDKTLQTLNKGGKMLAGKTPLSTTGSLKRQIDAYKKTIEDQEVRYGSSRIEDADY